MKKFILRFLAVTLMVLVTGEVVSLLASPQHAPTTSAPAPTQPPAGPPPPAMLGGPAQSAPAPPNLKIKSDTIRLPQGTHPDEMTDAQKDQILERGPGEMIHVPGVPAFTTQEGTIVYHEKPYDVPVDKARSDLYNEVKKHRDAKAADNKAKESAASQQEYQDRLGKAKVAVMVGKATQEQKNLVSNDQAYQESALREEERKKYIAESNRGC